MVSLAGNGGQELTGKEHQESFSVTEMLSEWVTQVSAFVDTDETVPLSAESFPVCTLSFNFKKLG